MRNKRILMAMAGLLPTPFERRENRLMRRLNRYGRELEVREQLLTLIQRRERGEPDAKPMPLARESHDE